MSGKVLIIRYEGNPFAIRMSKVIKTILEAGLQCDVLIPQDGLGTVDVGREMGWDIASKVRLYEFPLLSSSPGILYNRITGGSLFGGQLFESYLTELLCCQEYDVIMVKDTQCLRRVFRARQRAGRDMTRIVCDMYENATAQLYDYTIRFGSWRQRLGAVGRALIPRLRKIEITYLPGCDHIFVVVEEMKEFLVRQYGLEPSRISVVHNVEILSEFDQIDDSDKPLVKDKELIISYVGGIAPHRGVEVLLDAMAKLDAASLPSFRLVIVGANEIQKRKLTEICEIKGIQKLVNIYGFLPHRAAMQWIKRTDIGVIPHADTEFIQTTIPNKLFQYMAAGAMCLVSDVGPLGRIVRSTNCGVTFSAGSADDLADQLTRVLQYPEQIHQMGANGRISCERHYRWEIEGQLYTSYFSDMLV